VADEREDVADELRQVRAGASAPAVVPPPGEPAPPVRPPATAPGREEIAEAEEAPRAPDPTAVNAGWAREPPPGRGLGGLLRRGLERLLGGRFAAQREWNAHQVRLDNEILRYVEARFAATHRHYDRLLGCEGRRLDEIDTRHALLERELAGHVRDLVRRIDVVLAESTRERAALEFALGEVRARLARLEETLRRRE
jgi:hypothetical protein